MITRVKLSAVRANSFVVVAQFTTFSQFWCHCLRIGGAAFVIFFVPDAALIRRWRLLFITLLQFLIGLVSHLVHKEFCGVITVWSCIARFLAEYPIQKVIWIEGLITYVKLSGKQVLENMWFVLEMSFKSPWKERPQVCMNHVTLASGEMHRNLWLLTEEFLFIWFEFLSRIQFFSTFFLAINFLF